MKEEKFTCFKFENGLFIGPAQDLYLGKDLITAIRLLMLIEKQIKNSHLN